MSSSREHDPGAHDEGLFARLRSYALVRSLYDNSAVIYDRIKESNGLVKKGLNSMESTLATAAATTIDSPLVKRVEPIISTVDIRAGRLWSGMEGRAMEVREAVDQRLNRIHDLYGKSMQVVALTREQAQKLRQQPLIQTVNDAVTMAENAVDQYLPEVEGDGAENQPSHGAATFMSEAPDADQEGLRREQMPLTDRLRRLGRTSAQRVRHLGMARLRRSHLYSAQAERLAMLRKWVDDVQTRLYESTAAVSHKVNHDWVGPVQNAAMHSFVEAVALFGDTLEHIRRLPLVPMDEIEWNKKVGSLRERVMSQLNALGSMEGRTALLHAVDPRTIWAHLPHWKAQAQHLLSDIGHHAQRGISQSTHFVKEQLSSRTPIKDRIPNQVHHMIDRASPAITSAAEWVQPHVDNIVSTIPDSVKDTIRHAADRLGVGMEGSSHYSAPMSSGH